MSSSSGVSVIVAFDSVTGHTQAMAQAVVAGVASVPGVTPLLRKIPAEPGTLVAELPAAAGLIIGSPVYYGLPSAAVKKFIDFTNVHHGKLVGKVGGAFANSAGVHGGCETTILALNNALLIHGMVIQGCSEGLHYGAAAVETPTEKDIECCKQLGARVAKLALKLHSS